MEEGSKEYCLMVTLDIRNAFERSEVGPVPRSINWSLPT